MKILWALIFSALLVVGCSALDKDNKPKGPTEVKAEVKAKLDLYRPLVKAQLDEYGLVRLEGGIGDSALFSCLARAGGAASFDPAILFVGGKPIRHPQISPSDSKTPISKDMVTGILWCLYDLHQKGNDDHARELVQAMISFGKDHKATFGNGLQLDTAKMSSMFATVAEIELGWMFCTEDDRTAYGINAENWYGRCFMPPAMIKDIYRIAKLVGLDCDATCKEYMVLGPNVPSDGDGFKRHLAVIGTVRNGFSEGAINDNSLKLVLQKAREAEPRNALYQAAFHTFADGDQADAYAALQDETLFPKDSLPTRANYCTGYLFQRDAMEGGQPNPDWLPCPNEDIPVSADTGRGVEFVFAASLALGELH